MKKTTSLLMVILLPLLSFSQINYSVKGKVILSDGYSPAGNVIALHPKDSTLIKGTSFFEGSFELDGLKTEEILLKLSSLEFDDTFLNIKYSGKPIIDLGEIEVNNSGEALDEIIIKKRKPVYTQKNDGTLEVLIENTTLSASSSVNEILSKSPEIISDETGALSVFGKGNAILYLNGKRITNSQLSLIPPSNVKKVEIIRNPSAKYDSEGAAVINITTIRQQNDGYKVNLLHNSSYSDFGGIITYSSMNLNHKKGKFSSNAYYSAQLGRERELLHTTRDRDAENGFLRTDLTTDWKRDFENFSYYGLGLQYGMNDGSYLSAEYSGFLENLGGNTISNNRILDDSNLNFYKSDIELDEEGKNNSISLNYNKPIDTLGTSLFIGGQYSNFDIGTDNLISEESIEQNNTTLRSLKNIQNLDIDILTGQVDFIKAFTNENKLEIGAKLSHVENDFGFDFLVSNDGINFINDPNLSNEFYYKESIGAGYVNFKSSFNKKINYTIGVRSEYTKYNLELSQLENQIIKDEYYNILPNLSVNRSFPGGYSLGFSYTSRINRPSYQRLNPILVYQDPYTSVQGNPELKPQTTHGFELNSKIKKITFNIGYSYTENPFGRTVLRGEEPNSYILKQINYGERHVFYTSISRTFTNEWWTSRNTASLKYTNMTEDQFDFERVEPKPNLYFYSNNRFDISDSVKAELMFWYIGDDYEGLHRRNSMYNATITLEKSFFKNSLKCRLIANDIFRSIIASGNYNVGQTDVYYNRRWSRNYFRLSINYKFGKLKKSGYKNKTTGDSETRRAQ